MHNTQITVDGNVWNLNHNGDYSGVVHVSVPDFYYNSLGQRLEVEHDVMHGTTIVKIPFEVFEELAAQKIQDDVTSVAENTSAAKWLRQQVGLG